MNDREGSARSGKLRRVWALVVKESRQIVRDPVLRALAASDLLFQMSFRIFGAVFLLFVVSHAAMIMGGVGTIVPFFMLGWGANVTGFAAFGLAATGLIAGSLIGKSDRVLTRHESTSGRSSSLHMGN